VCVRVCMRVWCFDALLDPPGPFSSLGGTPASNLAESLNVC